MLEDLSLRPRLIQAVYEWCLENRYTPYLAVRWRDDYRRSIPEHLAKGGFVVLNISPEAVRGLVIDKSDIRFTARFQEAAVDVHIAVGDVLEFYAKELGRGVCFPPVEDLRPKPSEQPPIQVI
jgi:stringent starvation protein B